ncbi:hypothetical protein NQ318_000327 [Aromia moschata]|uniref:Uncharacterized protein n=1 Tax=Aromia moschata TaxID=1265417 RepID=A0AAV8XTD4_9CUCU|nr:hypothetical protein NQ318_000327 [Aromia moschata]
MSPERQDRNKNKFHLNEYLCEAASTTEALETPQHHQATKPMRRRRMDRSVNNNGPVSTPITSSDYALHNNNNHVKNERLSPGTPDTSSRSRSVTPSSASHPDTPPASDNPPPPHLREELQRLHAESGRQVQQRESQRVSTEERPTHLNLRRGAERDNPRRAVNSNVLDYFSAVRNGLPPPLDPRFKSSTFPSLLPSLTPQNKENEANNKKPDFSVLNPFAGVGATPMFPPLIDMSTTQTLLAMVRTAKEAELQRPRIKVPPSNSPNCAGLQIPKRAESESPRLHEDISNWTVDDVCNFVSSIDICAEYAQTCGRLAVTFVYYTYDAYASVARLVSAKR